jgi:hypothetical protein
MSDEFKTQLDSKTIGELRQMAVKTYGISINREHTKKDLISLICAQQDTGIEFLSEAGPRKPEIESGWSRITVSNSTAQADITCRVIHNGYQVSIPFDKEVEIPTVTADYIKGLRVQKLVKVEDSNFMMEKHVEWVPKYGVTFHQRGDGPCPCPEKYITARREAILKPKRDFMAKHGFWPSDKKLRDPAYRSSIN